MNKPTQQGDRILKGSTTHRTSSDPARESKLIYGMACEKWGAEEEAWFRLFTDNFFKEDPIELSIFLVNENPALHCQSLKARLEGALKRFHRPLAVDVRAFDFKERVCCDYWISNSCFRALRKDLQANFGVIENRSLVELIATCFHHRPSRNAYEYDFLVDAYDFEKAGRGVIQKDEGILPRPFGSTAGPKYEKILSLLNTFCPPRGTVLEVGCGAGAFYKTIRMNGGKFRYTGIDCSRQQIARCLKNYPEGKFQVGDACRLGFDERVYDFVFENNVVIFTTDPVKAIAEMCRVGRGYIFFSLHVLKNLPGMFCYYPFSTIHDIASDHGAISIRKDQERFFTGNPIRHRLISENKVQTFTVKAPIFVPGASEFQESIRKMIECYSLAVEAEDVSEIKKEIWFNPNRLDKGVAEDDCVVTEDDRLIEVPSFQATYLLRRKSCGVNSVDAECAAVCR